MVWDDTPAPFQKPPACSLGSHHTANASSELPAMPLDSSVAQPFLCKQDDLSADISFAKNPFQLCTRAGLRFLTAQRRGAYLA